MSDSNRVDAVENQSEIVPSASSSGMSCAYKPPVLDRASTPTTCTSLEAEVQVIRTQRERELGYLKTSKPVCVDSVDAE